MEKRSFESKDLSPIFISFSYCSWPGAHSWIVLGVWCTFKAETHHVSFLSPASLWLMAVLITQKSGHRLIRGTRSGGKVDTRKSRPGATAAGPALSLGAGRTRPGQSSPRVCVTGEMTEAYAGGGEGGRPVLCRCFCRDEDGS